jgi:hypothetical protein
MPLLLFVLITTLYYVSISSALIVGMNVLFGLNIPLAIETVMSVIMFLIAFTKPPLDLKLTL